MEKDNRMVHGSYDNSEETISAIRQLREEGYTKEQIRVYTNAMNDKTYDKTEKDPDGERLERTFDKTNENNTDMNEEGSFDTVDKNAEERSTEGSFDIVDSREDNNLNDDDDESLWDKVKDFFTPDSYDYDESAQNPNYRKENDVLYPHRNDLANGKRVIVLDKANENQTRINI